MEIEKVNNFADGLRKHLLKRFASAQEQHDALTAGGSDEADLQALRAQLAECSGGLYDFESFININYLAFSKILKKHDKMSSCPCRAPYLLRIQRETFARQCLPELIKGISDLHASLEAMASQPGTPEMTGGGGGSGEKKSKHGQFDSAQKGGTTFIRSTRKFWVATADVLKVKTFLLRHLPVYKFTAGATDSDLVTSIYYDSPSRRLYDGRLKKFEGAIALRVRWYGPSPADEDTVFIERKVHREDWFNEGRSSTKERFPVRADEVAPLINGVISTDELRARLEKRNFKGSIDDAVALADEIQRVAKEHGLRPSLRTHYLRTAFQKTGDASVRISLDTDLCMSIETCEEHEWRRSAPLTSLAQLTHFPHAVLELKLQLASDGSGVPPEPPAWVTELLSSGVLIASPKFSKFVHGTAMLYRGDNPFDGNPPVRELPYWWSSEVRPMWDIMGESKSAVGKAMTKGHKGAKGDQNGNGSAGGKANGNRVFAEKIQPGPLATPAEWHIALRRFFESIVTCGNKDL